MQVTPPMGPRQLTFHRVFSWRECKVPGILMGGYIFLFYRETRMCLSSSNLYPFILQNRYSDLRRYIFLLAAFSNIFQIYPSLHLQCKITKLDKPIPFTDGWMISNFMLYQASIKRIKSRKIKKDS